MKIAFTVKEVCKISFDRYKHYIMPESLTFPSEWKDWSVDEKYTWVNNNCHFHSDFAEETESEVIDEVATEMEIEE